MDLHILKRRFGFLRWTLVLSGLLLGGCGGDAPPQTSGNGAGSTSGTPAPVMVTSTPVALDLTIVDVCGLLTREEIEAAVGASKWNPRSRTAPGAPGKACDFMPEVTLVVGPPDMWMSAVVTSAGRTPIAGVGDEAFITENTLVANLKGRGIVKLSIFDFDNPYNPEQAKALVSKVIRRLP